MNDTLVVIKGISSLVSQKITQGLVSCLVSEAEFGGYPIDLVALFNLSDTWMLKDIWRVRDRFRTKSYHEKQMVDLSHQRLNRQPWYT